MIGNPADFRPDFPACNNLPIRYNAAPAGKNTSNTVMNPIISACILTNGLESGAFTPEIDGRNYCRFHATRNVQAGFSGKIRAHFAKLTDAEKRTT